MDEGRIALVKRQEDKHRKFVCILNDMIKTRDEEYQSCLNRERYEMTFKYVKNFMTVKQTIVRQKILQKCLAMRRRAAGGGDPNVRLFGQYGGVPLHGFSRDVEQHIINMHPKIRRIRRVQKLLRESKENGAILDEETAAEKIANFFKSERKSLAKDVEKRPGSGEKSNTRDITPQVRQRPGNRETKVDKHNFKSFISESRSSDPSEMRPDRRVALVLPPIYSTKALVQR